MTTTPLHKSGDTDGNSGGDGGDGSSDGKQPAVRCVCPHFRIYLRPEDKFSEAREMWETHLKFCPVAVNRHEWLIRLAEKVFSGATAFMVLALVIGWGIHEHGWPWAG